MTPDIFPQPSLSKADSTGFDIPEMIFVEGGTFMMGSTLGAVD
jgi:hypothetical protein